LEKKVDADINDADKLAGVDSAAGRGNKPSTLNTPTSATGRQPKGGIGAAGSTNSAATQNGQGRAGAQTGQGRNNVQTGQGKNTAQAGQGKLGATKPSPAQNGQGGRTPASTAGLTGQGKAGQVGRPNSVTQGGTKPPQSQLAKNNGQRQSLASPESKGQKPVSSTPAKAPKAQQQGLAAPQPKGSSAKPRVHRRFFRANLPESFSFEEVHSNYPSFRNSYAHTHLTRRNIYGPQYGMISSSSLFGRSAPAYLELDAPPSSPSASPTPSIPMTHQDLISFATLLLRHANAQAAFVADMNTNRMLYTYMSRLDPTIKQPGSITAREIQKVLTILSSSPQARDEVVQAVQADQSLAEYFIQFRAQFATAVAAGGVQARDVEDWDDVLDMVRVARRRDMMLARRGIIEAARKQNEYLKTLLNKQPASG
jgi:hypothetical protein